MIEEDENMNICLPISRKDEIKLIIKDNVVKRFSKCTLLYILDGKIVERYEDYVYIFVEEILGRIYNIPVLINGGMLGKLGQWQEYYYFEDSYNEQHLQERVAMNSAVVCTTEKYSLFLYQYKNQLWLELNRGYHENSKLSPMEYYSKFQNYRACFTMVTKAQIEEWENKLKKLEKEIKGN